MNSGNNTAVKLPNEMWLNIAEFLDLPDLMYMRTVQVSHYNLFDWELKCQLGRKVANKNNHRTVLSAIDDLTSLEFFVLLKFVSILEKTRGRFGINIIHTHQNEKGTFQVLDIEKYGLKQWNIMLYCNLRMDKIEKVIEQCLFDDRRVSVDRWGTEVFKDDMSPDSDIIVHKTEYLTIYEDKLVQNKATSPFTMISYRFQI
uniref:F-box domain-containing protein n=1 Tax=viral metagenome TaxID=1070528 RepID=A0A6C0H7K1_9ZZZZ